ncbi:hypothetical protein D3C85_1308430 [compost metagenome]
MTLGDIARRMNLLVQHHEHALPARFRACRHAHRVKQIQRTIGRERRGGAHCRRQHHRHRTPVRQVQEHRRFFKRVGAVRDDHARHIGLRNPVLHARGERRPQAEGHVLAVDLGHLLRLHTSHLAQRGHGLDE